MKEIKLFHCDGIPTEDEVRQGMNIANHEHCIVVLSWEVKYSGAYKIDITEGCTYEDCVKQMPTVYPV